MAVFQSTSMCMQHYDVANGNWWPITKLSVPLSFTFEVKFDIFKVIIIFCPLHQRLLLPRSPYSPHPHAPPQQPPSVPAGDPYLPVSRSPTIWPSLPYILRYILSPTYKVLKPFLLFKLCLDCIGFGDIKGCNFFVKRKRRWVSSSNLYLQNL